MAQDDIRRNTIARQHTARLLLALAAGVLVFLFLDQATGFFTDRYLDRSGYYEAHDKKVVQSLQDYVRQEQVAVGDAEALTAWGEQQKNIFFQIYEDDRLVFQYYSKDAKSFREAAGMDFLEWISSYPVQFADGTFKVVVFGDYYYKPFRFTMVLNVLGAFAVFLIIFLTGIRKRTRYIRQLRDEIEILGSGDLDYEITVRGNDELTDLAENLDQMRQALRHHMREEARLTEERGEIVTRLSHDIRTPLTSMSLFVDLLKRGNYETTEQRDHYLDRIQENAANLTNLSEELFQAARSPQQIATADEESGETSASIDVAPTLADAAEALRLSGFTVEETTAAADPAECVIPMDRQAFARVLDNITSNILRYADPTEPVVISCGRNDEAVTIAFENAISPSEETSSGSGIGLRSVRALMEQAGGTVKIGDDGRRYRIELRW